MAHTPLCPKNCNTKHHDVVTSLQAVAPRFNSSVNASIPGPARVTRGNNKEDFKKQVQKLVSKGWTKDKEVPDPSKLLKLPLLHLASMFGKHEVVEWLLNDEGYDPKLRTSKSSETALHLVARHLYTALSASESRLENMSITAKVTNFERIVSLLIGKELSLFWAKDGLNRETPFHILARHLLQASRAEVEPETEDLCLSFYAKSFDVILKIMLAETQSRLNRRDIKHTLSIKNSQGNTALHLLAQANHQGYLVLKFLVKTLGNNDLLKIKNAVGLTAMDIVNQVYPGHERELLVDEEAKKKAKGTASMHVGSHSPTPKPMELLQFLQSSTTNAICGDIEAGNTVGGNTENAKNRCAIHTESFPGLCSDDCSDTMDAVGTLVNTHTPLCPTGCDLQHHLLTSAVFSPSVIFRSCDDACVPVTFKLCIQACFSAGWERDMIVPDPLESLQYPLLHLICISGNCVAAAKVIKEMKFSFSVSPRSKETPLHVAARYFPVAYPDCKASTPQKIIAKFEAILNLLINQDDDMLFMADVKGDTVMHVLAKCFCVTSDLMIKTCGPSSNYRNSLIKQKRCYFEVMKLLLEKIADLVTRERVCKKVVCRLVHKKNDASETFWDILKAGPDLAMLRILTLHAKEMLPFCFDNERRNLERNLCDSSCPCEGSSDSQSRSCQTQPFEIEGEIPVQEPVSSSVSPSTSMEHRNTNMPQFLQNAAQVIPATSPPVIEVEHTPTSPRRPQAQVQSIQLQGQAAMTGNPSLQTSAVASPAQQHTPVVFIKQEPLDMQYGTQCFYSINNHIVGPSARQNAFIFHSAPAVTTVGPLPVQEVGRRVAQNVLPLIQQPLPPCPLQSQPSRQGVTHASTGSMHTSAVHTQTTASRSLHSTQSMASPSQSRGRNIESQSERQVLPQSMERHGKRKTALEEMVLETLSDTSYKIDCKHTPLCKAQCSTEHHHLILSLSSSSNRTGHKGTKTYNVLSKTNFFRCLMKNISEGFEKDVDISDGLDELQYPLIHLAGIFYKYCAIDMMSLLGFNLNVCSQRTGEYPLHAVLHHNFKTGLKVYKGTTFYQTGYVWKVFVKVLNALTNGLNVPEIFSQQDRNGDTPFHVAAKRLIERPVPTTSPPVVSASEIPDSTQESNKGSSQVQQPSTNPSTLCNMEKTTKWHQPQAEFYTNAIGAMVKKLEESAMTNCKLDLDLVMQVLLVKNNDGETFLQILCKEHHVAAASISKVLSRFPLVVLSDCAKDCIPKSCWPDCIPTEGVIKQKGFVSGDDVSEPVSSPVEMSATSNRQEDAQPSESPKPSDGSVVKGSPTTYTTIPMTADAEGSDFTPISATPLPKGTPETVNLLDAMLTPVVANPSHATLRPNTKRKIIDALKEDYAERLELAVKGRCEVEEDVLKHKLKTRELTELMMKKKEDMQKIERELQDLQKEIWHENQAVQALESSLEQFTKEEEEMQKNLAVLQDADPEPPTKKSKTYSEQDTRL